MPHELAALINLLVTAALAIVLTVVVQSFLVLLWKRCVNRRYYLQERLIASAMEARDDKALRAAVAGDLGLERRCLGVCGPRRRRNKPPAFRPFPKSLVWPAPLHFASAIFVTGLTRASVRLLTTRPESCGAMCLCLPIGVLLALLAFILNIFYGFLDFYRKHSTGEDNGRDYVMPACQARDCISLARQLRA